MKSRRFVAFLTGCPAGAFLALAVLAAPAHAQSYRYDALGRMTSATYADGTSALFIYDAAGNLLSITGGYTTAPAISSQPASQTVNAGGTATFSVTASAAQSYQWYFNGALISGATGSTLSLANVQAGNAGTYTVTATNFAGSVSSASATLSLGAVLPGAPTGVSAVAGNGLASVSFTAPANTGGAALTGYTVTATPSSGSAVKATGTSSPIVVAGLTNGVTYTFTVVATSSAGTGPASSASAAVALATSFSFTTLAGTTGSAGTANGTGSAARFSAPAGVAVDSAGNVYVADPGNDTIRKITIGGVVTTLAGSGGLVGSSNGTGSAARFDSPFGVALDSAGNVYVADSSNDTIREITSGGMATTLAGTALTAGSANATGSAARFSNPTGVAVDSAGNVYVADANNDLVRKIASGGVVTTLAGTAGVVGSTNGTGTAARFNSPQGVAVDNAGNVYVADAHNQLVRKITSGGVVTTLAGSAGVAGSANGTGTAAQFNGPAGVAVDGGGNVYVAEQTSDTIRMITSGGVVTTLAGSAGTAGSANGTGSVARFNSPFGVAVDSAGNIYVGEEASSTVRWGALALPVLTSATAASATDGHSFTYTATFPGVLDNYSASGLPAGLSIAAATGVISGTPTVAGTYAVALDATNGAGMGAATLNLSVNVSPSITTQPASQTVNTVATVTFAVAAGGTPTPSYQWQVSVNGGTVWSNLSDGSAISGSSTATLTLNSAASRLNGYQYRCVVTNSQGSVTSSAATLTAKAASVPGTYFGAIGGNLSGSSASAGVHAEAVGVGTNIAVEVNTAGTGGVLIGYVASINAGFAASFTFNSDGSFATKTTTLTGGTSATQTLTFNGQVSNGVISGTIVELALPFAATLDPSGGTTAAVSDFYPGNASSASAGQVYSIVGTQGEVFALSVSPAGVGEGTGTVSSAGAIAVQTQNSVTISGTVNPSSSTITGTVTQSTGGPQTFSSTNTGPSFTLNPQAETIATGRSVAFNVIAAGAPAPTYQWSFNGTPISGATDAILLIGNTTSANAGSYTCVATNFGGSATSSSATLTVISTSKPGYLTNLSGRGVVGSGAANALIGGFVISGSASKQLLLRGMGPGLNTYFGLGGYLTDTQLTLYNAAQAAVAQNSPWGGTAALVAAQATLGAYSVPPNSLDSMLYPAPIVPASYSAGVSGVGGATGVAAVEVYDADAAPPASKLVNVSVRVPVGTGGNILVGGFVIGGSTAETVLIRGLGPGLTYKFGLGGTLAQPVLTLFQGLTPIYSNAAWGGDPVLASAQGTVGGYSIQTNSADSLLLVSLPPGGYTAQISGANNTTGIAAVEIYELY